MTPILVGIERSIDEEFSKLLASYWDKENPGHDPLNMDWMLYANLTDQGRCMTFTARTLRHQLVGAAMYLIIAHPHHMHTLIAECDIICTHPNYRGQGIAKRTMALAEKVLVNLGVKRIVHRFKLQNNAPMFPALGFEAEETVYVKKVG